MPECNRLVSRAGEELIEAAKRNDFCKVVVPGSGFPLAAPAGPREWGLWLGQELLDRGAVICHELTLWGGGGPPCNCPNLPCPAPPAIIVPP